ncbi:hypothetical protein N7478_003727 [Penicillium angulare]|uniref:uncharacterized protein n=1 Tax=Penicillium angulare TaxID=116970 RepID=UPI0025408060|nr:uncharacterized protein N7478_003727 [Penicillium angulare]KAJ5288041.1 hypothetical protein N7478_003727 [Penicillium angulare]
MDAANTSSRTSSGQAGRKSGDCRADVEANDPGLDQVARLAEIFYESSHKLGNMVNHLLKERGMLQNGQQPESLKAILDVVQKEIDENAEKEPDSNDARSEPTPPSESADQQGPE